MKLGANLQKTDKMQTIFVGRSKYFCLVDKWILKVTILFIALWTLTSFISNLAISFQYFSYIPFLLQFSLPLPLSITLYSPGRRKAWQGLGKWGESHPVPEPGTSYRKGCELCWGVMKLWWPLKPVWFQGWGRMRRWEKGGVSEKPCYTYGAGSLGKVKPTVLVELSPPREGEHFTMPLGQTEPVPSAFPIEALWGHDPTERMVRERSSPRSGHWNY